MISFDKGKQIMKLDKYLLCTESRFFAPMLDGPSIASIHSALSTSFIANDVKRKVKHAASASATTSPTPSQP